MRSKSFAIAGLAVLLAVAGATYQALATANATRRNPEPGRLIDIGRRRINLYCIGQGAPTVILESGLGDFLNEWEAVQAGVAKFARVCSYDRAGYGASDPGPLPRTSARIAEDLHTLLHVAGEAGPYVLVGSSFGGYAVRVFNGQYPTEVVGIALIDATQEDQYDLLPKAWNAIGSRMLERYKSQARWAPILVDLGLLRLRLWLQGINVSHLVLQSKYLRARASELESMRISAEQARAVGPIGAKPLVVVTAGKISDPALVEGLSQRDLDAYQETWIDDLQLRLAHLSTQGKRVIVPNSGHDVPTERPDAIVSAVMELRDAGR